MAKPNGPAVRVVAERRITGRRLQSRRLEMWLANPHCAECGRWVLFPQGFELDHKVPLGMGGEDVEANCQILCVDSPDGSVIGCHRRKTEADLVQMR
ncbi:HNH endonuclease signature motif containing protein [Stutzerimonas frequens]